MAKKTKLAKHETQSPQQKQAINVKNLKNSFAERFFSDTKWPYVIIFILSLILYGNTLTLQYALDDRLLITENEFTKKGTDGLKDIMTNDSFVGFFGKKKNLLTGGRYRPLSQLMFAVEYQFFGLNPFIGHLLNVLLYGLACMVLLKVLKLLFASYKGLMSYMPFIITLFFTAHPLHTEIVANIKGRDDILSFLFSFLCMLFIIKYIDKKRIFNLILASILYLLALLSKENSVTFFAVVPLLMYFFFNLKFKEYLLPVLSLIVSVTAFFLLRFAVLGFEVNYNVETELLNNPYINATTAQKFATIFYTLGVYLKLLFFPHPLTHDYYPYHIELLTWSSFKAFIPLLIYLTLGIYAIIGIIKKHLPALGVAFYLITFSIASNIVFNIGTFMNERFLFMPLLGFCIIAAYYLIQLFLLIKVENLKALNYILAIAGIVVLVYAFKTIDRNKAWYDDFTLFTTDVKISENSAKVNTSAGGVLIEEAQKIQKSIDTLTLVIDEKRAFHKSEKEAVKDIFRRDTKSKINKNNVDDYLDNASRFSSLKTSLEKLQKHYYDLASQYLNKATKVHPKYSAAWVLYGNYYLYTENFEHAMTCYENALRISAQNNDARHNMVHLAKILQTKKYSSQSIKVFSVLSTYVALNNDEKYSMAGVYEEIFQLDSAVNLLTQILSNDSMNFNAHSKLGELYGKYYNNIDVSMHHLLMAYKIKPEDASNLENLGIAYGMKKDFVRSLFFFEEAMKHNPKKDKLLHNIAATYALMGDNKKADEFRQKAQKIVQEEAMQNK